MSLGIRRSAVPSSTAADAGRLSTTRLSTAVTCRRGLERQRRSSSVARAALTLVVWLSPEVPAAFADPSLPEGGPIIHKVAGLPQQGDSDHYTAVDEAVGKVLDQLQGSVWTASGNLDRQVQPLQEQEDQYREATLDLRETTDATRREVEAIEHFTGSKADKKLENIKAILKGGTAEQRQKRQEEGEPSEAAQSPGQPPPPPPPQPRADQVVYGASPREDFKEMRRSIDNIDGDLGVQHHQQPVDFNADRVTITSDLGSFALVDGDGVDLIENAPTDGDTLSIQSASVAAADRRSDK